VAVGAKHHSAYHRLLATPRWSLDEMGLAVAQLLIAAQPAEEMIMLALDDTLCRKHGRKRMYGVGMHHDPLISSRKLDVCNWGHSWVILGVVLRLPFAEHRCWCLPILFRLYRSKQTVARERGSYHTRPQLGVQVLTLLCQRFPMRRFHVLADMAYGGQSVLKHLPGNCELTSRLLLDARLVDDPPPRRPGASVAARRCVASRCPARGRCSGSSVPCASDARPTAATTACAWSSNRPGSITCRSAR